MKIIIAALFSSAGSSCALLFVYYLRYNTVAVYQWNKVNDELMRDSIVNLLLPTLLLSGFVGLVVALGIGLYASRKYAVPIYKIEQWTTALLNGKMTTVLRFREHEELKELTQKCNNLGGHICDTLTAIKASVKNLQETYPQNPDVESIASVLDKMELAEAVKSKDTVKTN